MNPKILRILTSGKLSTQLSILSKLAPFYITNRVDNRPSVLRVEITNKCNMNCIMCERKELGRKPIDMEFGLFKKIIDDAARNDMKVVGLNRFGEPTMHPQLPEMAEYAKAKGIKHISFVTNASLLSENLCRRLIRPQCIDEIVCSVDGNTPETYAKIRGATAFDDIVNNIERLIRMRNEMGLKKPQIFLNTIHMKLTEKEIPAIIKRWANVADGISILPFHEYGAVRDTGLRVENKFIRRSEKKNACPFLAYTLVAYADGGAGVCCGDSNGIINVGSFRTETIKDIWNGEKITRIRQIHFRKDFDLLPICNKCEVTNHITYWGKHYLYGWFRSYST